MTNRLEKIEKKYGRKALAEWGRKGGQAKVLKGLAWLKIHDPERFKAIYERRSK